jgi:hypothetical protein
MTLKISVTPKHWEYLQNKENGTWDPRMFLDINGDDYEFVIHDSRPVDILLLTANELAIGNFRSWNNYRIAVMLDIWHGVEGQSARLGKKLQRCNEYIITCIVNCHNTPRIISNDFMFNRTKAYYSQFPFSPGVVKWYSHGQLSYIIPNPKDADQKKKIFVAPCKTYPDKPRLSRNHLRDILRDTHNELGYLGNIDADPTMFLYPHIEFPYCNNIEEIENQTRPLSYNWWGYSPPHSEYYRNTFISIYSESIEFGPDIIVSEKTYDPLIKGHFILPFSNYGFIKWLCQLGIQFPEFIDYNYDTLEDDDQRMKAYFAEVNRLLSIPIEQWRQHYINNLKLLRHNQLMFHYRNYDRVNFKELLNAQ